MIEKNYWYNSKKDILYREDNHMRNEVTNAKEIDELISNLNVIKFGLQSKESGLKISEEVKNCKKIAKEYVSRGYTGKEVILTIRDFYNIEDKVYKELRLDVKENQDIFMEKLKESLILDGHEVKNHINPANPKMTFLCISKNEIR